MKQRNSPYKKIAELSRENARESLWKCLRWSQRESEIHEDGIASAILWWRREKQSQTRQGSAWAIRVSLCFSLPVSRSLLSLSLSLFLCVFCFPREVQEWRKETIYNGRIKLKPNARAILCTCKDVYVCMGMYVGQNKNAFNTFLSYKSPAGIRRKKQTVTQIGWF